jgi:hypothetical protein
MLAGSRRRAFGLALLLCCLQGWPAAAQSAEANLLFDEGRKSMARRDYVRAIEQLQQSQKLDPAVGTTSSRWFRLRARSSRKLGTSRVPCSGACSAS